MNNDFLESQLEQKITNDAIEDMDNEIAETQDAPASQLKRIVIGLINELKGEAEKLDKQEDWYSKERLKGYNDAISDLGVAARELGYTKEAL